MEAAEKARKLKLSFDIFFFSIIDLGVSEEKLYSRYMLFPPLNIKIQSSKHWYSWESFQQSHIRSLRDTSVDILNHINCSSSSSLKIVANNRLLYKKIFYERGRQSFRSVKRVFEKDAAKFLKAL